MVKERNHLPSATLPQNYKEVIGHDVYKKLLNCWHKDTSLYPYSLFVSGSAGTGKNSLINAFLRTARCSSPTISQGMYMPCEACANCKKKKNRYGIQDIRDLGKENNVFWVQKGTTGDSSSVQSQVKNAIEECYSPPYGSIDPNTMKFIIINELQAIDQATNQTLLGPMEHSDSILHNRVMFIFITMDEAKLKSRNPELHSATTSRSSYISLKKLNTEQFNQLVVKFATEIFNTPIPYQSIELLRQKSDGNIRELLKMMQQIHQLEPSFSVPMVSELTNLTTSEERIELWNALQKSDYKKAYDIFEQLSTKADTRDLLAQLSKDIDTCMFKGFVTEDQMIAHRNIYYYLTGSNYASVWDVLKTISGLKLVSPDLLESTDVLKILFNPS